MGFKLRGDLSYCEVSDRLVFLDLPSDRYFCLSPRLEAGFRAAVAGIPDVAPAIEIAPLLNAGLLMPTRGPELPTPCILPQPPRASFLDERPAPARPIAVGVLAAGIALSRLALRIGRFHQAIARLAERKAAIGNRHAPPDDAMRDLAAQFERTGEITQVHDRCLPRSLALASYAVRRGWPVDLVLAVQLRPFAAHCWVQAGAHLLNDRIDTVRPFTPILVV
ncbi:lasso peptide biosynthesis B2 protein [Novosphingobium sp.]|jgi:hypothetical protein|uniref:lasso peptide biosynthesis B2 protein n=1 Tax=Novosphingobium sp. TaxID=1874826 RepID=UPI002FDF4943